MWTLEYSEEAERDFELIFDHLFGAYVELGDSIQDGVDSAVGRIRRLRSAIDRLADTPYIGTSRPDIRPDIRFVRRGNAAIWFSPIEDSHTIRVIAVFYGAQDHIRHMLARMLKT